MIFPKQRALRSRNKDSGLTSSIKELVELAFWRKTLWKSRGRFYNAHLVPFYTIFFGLEPSFYAGKRVLDVGCGPAGTLEWANDALERIGLDPLVEPGMEMNGGRHKTAYIAAPSEAIPYRDGYFDIVTMFNALDHVSDVDRTVEELARVCMPGGTILLIVEINHPPTVTQPHRIGMDLVGKFAGFTTVKSAVFGIRPDHDIYGSLADRHPFPGGDRPGILCLRLARTPS